MGHDQLFKAVLQAFFRDFLQLFYPNVAKHLDFETLRFLDKELSPDFPEGRPREVDIVAGVQTHEGSPKIVLVHIEVETDWRRAFAERMFNYYIALWERYRIPIVPIVVYLRGGRKGLIKEEYRMSHFGEEHLRFRYHSVRLAKLPAGEYLRKGTPLGAALAALMDRRTAGEPLSLRALMLQQVAESERDDAQKLLLLNVIETYFKLTAEQKESFSRLLSKEEYREAREMEVTWADEIAEEARKEGLEKGIEKGLEKGLEEGLEKGLEEGRQAGLMAGKQEALTRQLATKFGPLPEQITSRVQAMASLDELDVYLDRVLTAKSLEDMGLGG